jgi:hypothetical protein
MKFNAFVYLTLCMIILIWGCSQLAPNGPQAAMDKSASISASLSVHENIMATADIDTIQIKVYGSGIDTIKKDISFDGPGTSVSLKVPAGKSLILEVMALKGNVVVLRGSNSFLAEKDQTIQISIKMEYMLSSLILSPPDSSFNLTDQFDIYVSARNVTNMATIGAQVKFDTSAFKVLDIAQIDSFLQTNSGNILPLNFSKDNINGEVNIQLGLVPSLAAVSGKGDICKITFQPKKTGNAEIGLNINNSENANWGLFDSNAKLISSLGLGSKIVIN